MLVVEGCPKSAATSVKSKRKRGRKSRSEMEIQLHDTKEDKAFVQENDFFSVALLESTF
jgi:hypothetical protein